MGRGVFKFRKGLRWQTYPLLLHCPQELPEDGEVSAEQASSGNDRVRARRGPQQVRNV